MCSSDLIPLDNLVTNQGTDRRDKVADELLKLLFAGLLNLHGQAVRCANAPSSQPRTTRLVRHQATRAQAVTSLRHAPVVLDELSRHLLQHLDGEHDIDALSSKLLEAAVAGDLELTVDEQVLTDKDAIEDALRSVIPQTLATLARNALLCA